MPKRHNRPESEVRMPRLLVVDDDPGVRDTLDTLFTLEGFTVALAADAESAVATLAKQPVDLVLSDYVGLAAAADEGLAALRSAAMPTPIVLLTGHPEAPHWHPSELGMVAIIEKPFEVADLVCLVRSYLAKAA
jgi:DNA-binding NtrC family response regulator